MARPRIRTGDLRSTVRLEKSNPVALALLSLTRVDAVATATTAVPHRYVNGDVVSIAGAAEAAYNGDKKVTVTGPSTFTFAVAGAPATPATGAITALFKHAAIGGTRQFWNTFATVPGSVEIAPGAREALQAGQPIPQVVAEIQLRYRSDVTAKMRAVVDERIYEIQSVAPDQKKTQLTLLALEVPA